MASIPLPALHVDPPQPNNTLAMLAQLQQYKNAQTQNQANQIGIQEKQMQLNDQKTLRGLYVKHSGDLDKVIADAPQAGVSPQTIQQLQLHNIDAKTKTADLVAKNSDLAIKQADLMSGAHDAVDKATPDQKPIVYAQQLQGLQKMGIDVSQLPPEYPGDDSFKVIGATVKGHKQLVEDAFKAAETSKNNAQAGEATAQTNKINTEINPDNPADPNIRKQKYEGILQKIQQNGLSGVTPQEMQFARAFEFGQQKTTTQSDSLGVASTNISTPSGISGAVAASRKNAPAQGVAPSGGGAPAKPALGGLTKLTPAQAKEGIVDMIGNYKLGLGEMARAMAKHPELPALVGAKYPDWDQTTYNAKNKLITGYTSGPQSKEINAINTAMGHIKNLDDAVDALHNGDMTILNKIGKAYNINVGGKTAEAAFQLIVHRVGPEIASAYIPGGGGVAERMADEKDFDVNLPPQTLHNNAAVTVNMLRSKIGALENQYKNAVGRDDFAKRFITPEAQASLQKFSPQSSSGPAKAGGFDFNKFPNVHP